jgi:Rps23 Pro-64 3,4-dihydroxylase Tpa1-like proline 4-hydroxylase|tara:strand:- start:4612 stop:5184 length:573 start_codon:yes stop_codon:yes gene_type:complete
MEIEDYIKIYDEVIPYPMLSIFIKWINTIEFTKATVLTHDGKSVLNEKSRSVNEHALFFHSNSKTNVKWTNYLFQNFLKKSSLYCSNFIHPPQYQFINYMSILKYEKNDHYKYHTDHAPSEHRTLSLIYLLNNDYKGGNLLFTDAKTQKEEFMVEVKANRLIIWPSNFMFPHKVSPVTEGTRYSVVAWMI